MTAISRYGARVIPNTLQIIDEMTHKGQLLEGPHIAAFEASFASRLGVASASAASYGRMAFYYVLQAMELPSGGEVVFPALTFWVMPEIARVAGLTPVFADVDPATFNMTPESLDRAITPRTVAVVPTHLWGLPCDMDAILAVASRRGIRVVEDCAHALGARYRGQPVGTFGDAAIFSFQTLKPLNTYGGGMAIARDPDVARRIAHLAAAEPVPDERTVRKRLWHGRVLRIAVRPSIFTWTLFPMMYACMRLRIRLDVYFWEGIRPLSPLPSEYRERYSNVQAALGLEALSHLDAWTCATQRNAARMTAQLQHVRGVVTPVVPDDRTHAFYQYCAYVPSRDTVVKRCLSRGVDIETLHADLCTDLDLFGASPAAPGARTALQTVQIPVYPSMTEAELDRVASVVRDAVVELGDAAPAAVRT